MIFGVSAKHPVFNKPGQNTISANISENCVPTPFFIFLIDLAAGRDLSQQGHLPRNKVARMCNRAV
jgi:hypothetical protein